MRMEIIVQGKELKIIILATKKDTQLLPVLRGPFIKEE